MKVNYSSLPLRFFYLVMGVILGLLKKNVDAFKRYKALYTDSFVQNLIDKLAAAKALPTVAILIARRKQARIELIAQAIILRNLFMALKGYIETAYDETKWQTALEEAGLSYFRRGATKWGFVEQMSTAAIKFITENATALKDNNNMPDTFLAEFTSAGAKFENALTNFTNATEAKKTAKVDKIKANNEVYDAVVSISKDAAVVYKGDDEARENYSIAYQLAVLKGGSAKFETTVVDEHGVGIPGVNVGSTDGKYGGVTSAQGKLTLSKLEHGDYIFVFAKNGLDTQQIPVTLKPATAKRVKVTMMAEMQVVAA